MSSIRPVPSSTVSRPGAAERRMGAAEPARRQHRERDFGIGYGSSSGYASGKRYTPDWRQPHFRCA